VGARLNPFCNSLESTVVPRSAHTKRRLSSGTEAGNTKLGVLGMRRLIGPRVCWIYHARQTLHQPKVEICKNATPTSGLDRIRGVRSSTVRPKTCGIWYKRVFGWKKKGRVGLPTKKFIYPPQKTFLAAVGKGFERPKEDNLRIPPSCEKKRLQARFGPRKQDAFHRG